MKCRFDKDEFRIEPCEELARATTSNRRSERRKGWTPLQIVDDGFLVYHRATNGAPVPLRFCPFCGVELARRVD